MKEKKPPSWWASCSWKRLYLFRPLLELCVIYERVFVITDLSSRLQFDDGFLGWCFTWCWDGRGGESIVFFSEEQNVKETSSWSCRLEGPGWGCQEGDAPRLRRTWLRMHLLEEDSDCGLSGCFSGSRRNITWAATGCSWSGRGSVRPSASAGTLLSGQNKSGLMCVV